MAATGVDVETRNGKRLHFVWVSEVGSTQDETRKLVNPTTIRGMADPPDVVALAAGAQTNGRGTSGRKWVGLQGNLFLTVTVNRSAIPFVVTLLPLRIGTIIGQTLASVLPSSSTARVSLKWPNDVLIAEKKVSGLLIESEGDTFLLGVGVNVAQTPEVPPSGKDHGRAATCLAEHGLAITDDTVKGLALSLSRSITEWVGTPDSAEDVVRDWRALTDWSREYTKRDDGRVVQPLALESDGRLRVRDIKSGATELLVAEYLL